MATVALFTRAWIEIADTVIFACYRAVALFTRAWIEMDWAKMKTKKILVALFTRAWIEIFLAIYSSILPDRSPFSRGRGLKY